MNWISATATNSEPHDDLGVAALRPGLSLAGGPKMLRHSLLSLCLVALVFLVLAAPAPAAGGVGGVDELLTSLLG